MRFKDAGASEEKSKAASQAIADYEKELYEIKTELKAFSVKQNIVLALLMAIVLKLFLPEFVKLMG